LTFASHVGAMYRVQLKSLSRRNPESRSVLARYLQQRQADRGTLAFRWPATGGTPAGAQFHLPALRTRLRCRR
jgi:hypothetical protein